MANNRGAICVISLLQSLQLAGFHATVTVSEDGSLHASSYGIT